MRIVALEEHVSLAPFNAELEANAPERGGRSGAGGAKRTELEDVDNLRLASMDANGISVQVLSVPGPGAAMLSPDAAPSFAQRYNDELAAVVARHPGRFAAFAHLPMTVPGAAADELERAVRECGSVGALISGQTRGKFLDDPSYAPLLARAEALDVPIYIHPGIPPESVRKAYYDGFSPHVSSLFATAGFGWHAETAVHVLRMVLAGTFDRHPRLKIIIGHMGEGLPTMLARCDDFLNQKTTGLPRPVSQTILDHVTITLSGFWSQPPFLAALLTFGVDRMLFSVDYPFSDNTIMRTFLDSLPVAPDDKVKISHANADRLLKLEARVPA
ncbi:MAG: amidohydrolase family protein [Candidatus Lustribacter sp.]|jgi:predicted TIM-barrel fold metal-dependent hydrolase